MALSYWDRGSSWAPELRVGARAPEPRFPGRSAYDGSTGVAPRVKPSFLPWAGCLEADEVSSVFADIAARRLWGGDGAAHAPRISCKDSGPWSLVPQSDSPLAEEEACPMRCRGDWPPWSAHPFCR